jgi:hypothetical protein
VSRSEPSFHLRILIEFVCRFRALILNENFDTREFSLFISNKRWMKNILRPLLELCAKEDR